MASIRIINKKLAALTCFSFFLLSFSSMAQLEKKTMHNGQLQTAGNYNIEVVDCYGYLEIYLYNQYMQPVFNGGITGYVNFFYADGSKSSSKAYPYGIDAFTSEPEKDIFSSCEVVLTGRSISINLTFKDLVCIRPGD